jgi:hypothetical protein
MTDGKSTKKATEQQRLSAALRENLKRRKAQARSRAEADGAEPAPHRSARIGADNKADKKEG